ncbi:MarR family winged helix-turn-helix transcriptional regulator [Agromyces sp. SYSU T00194]|uniref:MarR family winged helix-turn-helix transcriptional regulator n=1 Tax=Agromyces chitinivorans TaxID=3158560 RepID=UPI003390C2EE
MDTETTPEMTGTEEAAWVRLVALAELLPGVLDAQLLRDAQITHFEYLVLMTLAGSPDRTSRMTRLASRTNATLPRLSHVARRLEQRELIERFPCPEDRRATNARLTDTGVELLDAAAPGHVDTVRHYVLDALSPDDLDRLYEIAGILLERLDPDGRMTATSCHPAKAAATAEPAGAH